MQGLFLILFSAILCKLPSRIELIGIACVIAGCLSMMYDRQAIRIDGESGGPLIYICVILLSVFPAIMFGVNSYNVKLMPPVTLIWMHCLYSWAWSSFMARISDSRVQIFSNDTEMGCLGFMNSETWIFAFLVGLISGVIFWLSGMLALQIFSPVIVANSLLLDPFIAQLWGCAVGTDRMPGPPTWLGTSVCMTGLVCFYYGSK